MADIFGDRMKDYEKRFTGKLMSHLPICARLDGRTFNKFTRGLDRPFDEKFAHCMKETTKYLVQETCALMGYTQSDEITLIWFAENPETEVYFAGKLQKMVSMLAAETTLKFNELVAEYLPEKASLRPKFDCRVWQVPNKEEGANVFLWRELDATKNSVSMAAREYYSHKQLMNLGRSDQMELLYKAGVNWNDYPTHFKRGTYFQRKEIVSHFTDEERDRLPDTHPGKYDPDFSFKRKRVRELDMPIFSTVTNRADVIFSRVRPLVVKVSLETKEQALGIDKP